MTGLRIEPLERLEDAIAQLGRHPGPVIDDGEPHATRHGCDVYPH